jgi:hypothetical protein
MKNLFKVLLVAAVLALAYVCYARVETPIRFQSEKSQRELRIVESLKDIRTAQIAFKSANGYHTPSFEELAQWLQNGQVKTVRRQLELTEQQLEDGLTDEKALEIVAKARETGDWSEAEKENLVQNVNGTRVVFSRDTVFAPALATTFGDKKIDFSRFGKVLNTGKYFEMDTASIITGPEGHKYAINVFEAKTPFETYLGDLDGTELSNAIDRQTKLGKYPGMKVGSLTEINNNAGNWE